MTVTVLRATVIDASLDTGVGMWGDAAAGALPPGVAWVSELAAAGVPVRGITDPAADDGEGLLILPDPDAWDGMADRAMRTGRRLITGQPPPGPGASVSAVREALGALVRPDLSGVVVLRLDDPGASVRRHLRSWAHDDVEAESWDALWRAMLGFGRASIFCCPGWVRDDGEVVSSRVESASQWQAIDAGVEAGLADLECHGYTHLTPDTAAWARAPDRATSADWYRELWPLRSAVEPSVQDQEAILAAWQDACGPGTTLVAPGEAWGLNTVVAARRRGLHLLNSWSVCRLQLPVPTWTAGIGSPYLDEADPSWLAGGLPVVGYWHDRDMALHGPSWVPDRLQAWRDCGAKRAWAFADLARAWATPVDAALVDGEVVVRDSPRCPLLVEQL